MEQYPIIVSHPSTVVQLKTLIQGNCLFITRINIITDKWQLWVFPVKKVILKEIIAHSAIYSSEIDPVQHIHCATSGTTFFKSVPCRLEDNHHVQASDLQLCSFHLTKHHFENGAKEESLQPLGADWA